MSKDGPEIQSYYAARAREYDEIYSKPERQSDLRALERWLPPLFSNATLLEVACGTGYWTQFIAPSAAHVLAIDASPETMEIARRRVPDGKATFVVGDAYHLSPGLGKFDAAFAGFWFSHVPRERRREFLRGLHERLVPGARVVLLDNLYVEGSSSALAETDADGNTYQRRSLRDGSTHRVLKNFPRREELESSLGALGLRSTLTTWQYFWAFAYTVAEA